MRPRSAKTLMTMMLMSGNLCSRLGTTCRMGYGLGLSGAVGTLTSRISTSGFGFRESSGSSSSPYAMLATTSTRGSPARRKVYPSTMLWWSSRMATRILPGMTVPPTDRATISNNTAGCKPARTGAVHMPRPDGRLSIPSFLILRRIGSGSLHGAPGARVKSGSSSAPGADGILPGLGDPPCCLPTKIQMSSPNPGRIP